MIMKKFTLFFIALQMLVSAFAQENLYVCHKDGTYTEFSISDVEKVRLESDGSPYTPDDGYKVFSINPVDRVLFSPGNLQYYPRRKEWRFAPDQTAHVGKENENISPNYSGWIDLFGWGTGDDPTKTSMSYDSYSTFVDWGSNKIGDDEPNTWRTLSLNEWEYLLHSRENASDLITVGRVKGNNGVILLPDNWVCPDDVDLKIGFSSYEEGYASLQIISEPMWDKLEVAGAIFLPAIGYRKGVTINELQESCRYWAGYWHMTTSAAMFYGNSMEAEIAFTFPYDGLAVRLVSTQTF